MVLSDDEDEKAKNEKAATQSKDVFIVLSKYKVAGKVRNLFNAAS